MTPVTVPADAPGRQSRSHRNLPSSHRVQSPTLLPLAPTMIGATYRLLASNRQILTASCAQIACCRRLLNPGHSIAGGSFDDVLDEKESYILQHVRARLRRHTLPLAPKLVLAGRATVPRNCIVCRRCIRPGMMQHEFVADDGEKAWSHTVCLRIWIDATVGLASRTARSSRPSGMIGSPPPG